MRLLITTPTHVVVDEQNVVAVRAEDESGGFGILKGHIDFLTALRPSIVAWRDKTGQEHFCAVRRGVFSVSGGADISIATREAVVSDDLNKLEGEALSAFRQAADAERTQRTDSLRLEMRAIKQIVRYLRPEVRAFGNES